MAHYNQSARKAIADVALGCRVDRATATLPASTAAAIFTVVGGKCMITNIVGEVTTIIQNQANNTKLTANPTTGTSVDMCTVLSIANDEVGCLYGITGGTGDAMVGTNAGHTIGMTTPAIVNAGTIDLDCAATNTGAIQWSIWYIPLEDGAYIEAA